MKKLVLSQFYTLRCEMKILLLIFLVMLVPGVLAALFNSGYYFFVDEDIYGFGSNMTASTIFGMNSNVIGIMAAIYVLISVTLIAGGDMNDKTVNYEIMYGHSRRQVYWSRVIVSLIAGTFGGILIFLALPIAATLMLGWGTSISFGVLLIRLFMLAMLFFRMTAELIFLTAVIRKAQFVYIVEVLVLLMEIAAKMMFEDGNDFLFPLNAIIHILSFNQFLLPHLDETTAVIFDAAMPVSTIIGVSAAYILVAAVCLYLGSAAFERADLD